MTKVRCPACGHPRFYVTATSTFLVGSDGIEDHGDVEWGARARVTCAGFNCGFTATQRHFYVEDNEEDEDDD